MTYLLLFYEFFKTGLFAFGGGMATPAGTRRPGGHRVHAPAPS